jgi:hypothetical protein
MDKVYLVFLTVAGLLLLWDAFAPAYRDRAHRTTVRLLPLALFFWVLVPWFQIAERVF